MVLTPSLKSCLTPEMSDLIKYHFNSDFSIVWITKRDWNLFFEITRNKTKYYKKRSISEAWNFDNAWEEVIRFFLKKIFWINEFYEAPEELIGKIEDSKRRYYSNWNSNNSKWHDFDSIDLEELSQKSKWLWFPSLDWWEDVTIDLVKNWEVKHFRHVIEEKYESNRYIVNITIDWKSYKKSFSYKPDIEWDEEKAFESALIRWWEVKIMDKLRKWELSWDDIFSWSFLWDRWILWLRLKIKWNWAYLVLDRSKDNKSISKEYNLSNDLIWNCVAYAISDLKKFFWVWNGFDTADSLKAYKILFPSVALNAKKASIVSTSDWVSDDVEKIVSLRYIAERFWVPDKYIIEISDTEMYNSKTLKKV